MAITAVLWCWAASSPAGGLRAGHAQRPRERLEQRFDLVMARAAVQHLRVHVGARAAREALEEVVHQLGLQIADQPRRAPCVSTTAARVRRDRPRRGQRLVHRHHEVAGAHDAALVAERLVESLAERDADVLDRVVLIDVEIARGMQFQIEAAVPREQLQHVIEEANAGARPGTGRGRRGQRQADVGFVGLAVERRASALPSPHAGTPMACDAAELLRAVRAISRSVCASVPSVMRTQPAQPGSASGRAPECRAAAWRRTKRRGARRCAPARSSPGSARSAASANAAPAPAAPVPAAPAAT